MTDYYEALGVEAPAAEDGKAGSEITEPAAPDTQEAEGENGQEAAEPAEGGPSSEEQEDSSPVQSQEDNARYAAIRRRAEQEAQRKADKELNGLLSHAGLIDPYTQAPITSREELAAYSERYRQDKRQEFMTANNLDEAGYQNFVNELPEVQRAREETERLAAEGAQARLMRDLQEVQKLNPEIRSLEDLAQKPEYQQICEKVEKGLSLPEAYKLVYFDALTSRQSEAAKQAALNAVNSKGHMQQSGARGEGSLAVPADVAEQYRVFMPGITDAEIQEHYNRSMQDKEKS